MAEEKKENVAVPTPTAVTTAAEMKTQGADPNQFKTAFEQRQNASQANINNAFNGSLDAQRQSLTDAWQQSTAAQDAATTAGQNQFQAAQRDLGAQAARTAGGMNRYADVRGLNRQAGSQQALSLGLGTATAAGRLAMQQQMAAEESARQKALLSTDYNNRVQAAIADRDYKQAAALLDDYNNQNNWLDRNAEVMAGFGNFAGYNYLYGPDTAGMMQNFWIGSNPELAYNTGAIDAKRYQEITGRQAPGVIASSDGQGDWWDPYAHGGVYDHYTASGGRYSGSGGGSGGTGGGGFY